VARRVEELPQTTARLLPFAMADFMKILQQVKDMQGRFETIQKELESKTVTGSAGGGMVSVEADGKGTVRRIKLDPSIVKTDDVEMLEDLIVVAVSDAQKKAQAIQQEQMSQLAGGMQLPFKLPF
jgi:DNA-binding YbaB/EbfC family protein